MTFSPKVWSDALRLLQNEIPDFAIQAWIVPLEVKIDGDRLVLGCPTSFHRDRIRLHHLDAIARCWKAVCEAERETKAGETSIDVLTPSEFAQAPGTSIDLDGAGLHRDRSAAGGHGRDPISDAAPNRARMRKVEGAALARAVNAGDLSGGPSAEGVTPSSAASEARRDSVFRPSADPERGPESGAPPTTAFLPGAMPGQAGWSRPAAPPRDGRSGHGSGHPHLQVSDPSLPNKTVPTRPSSGWKGRDADATGAASPSAEDSKASNRHLDSVAGVSATRRGAEASSDDQRAVPPDRPSADLDFGLEGSGGETGDPFSFESFIVGPCNALAREATLALARRRQRSLNQLYLGGGSGMGKTHLARAAATEARRMAIAQTGHALHARNAATSHYGTSHYGASHYPASHYPASHYGAPPASGKQRGPRGARRVIYTSAEQFTSDFVSAMRNGRGEQWAKRYRGPIDLLIVEDIQLLSGRRKTQEELALTISFVLDSGGRVLLTGDRAPHSLTDLDGALRAQVNRGFVAELDRPDPLVRRHILRAKASAGGVSLPPECLDLLVEATGGHSAAAGEAAGTSEARMQRDGGSVRDLEAVLIQVVTTASLLGRPIDVDLTREAIDLKSGAASSLEPAKLSVAEVVQIVAAFFGKRPEALASRSRRRDVLVPRQLAMYLAHRYTDASLTEIGRGLGRDHPSVRNALTRVERQVLENAPLRYQVEALSERIDRRLEDARS